MLFWIFFIGGGELTDIWEVEAPAPNPKATPLDCKYLCYNQFIYF